MLKKMLGFDPAEIKPQVEELVASVVGLYKEQQRIAEFQNLLAQNAIKTNKRLDELHTLIAQNASKTNERLDALTQLPDAVGMCVEEAEAVLNDPVARREHLGGIEQ